MAKLPPPDTTHELNMSTTIAEARDSIKRIEGTTDRINKIVHEVKPDVRNHRRRDDKQDFSIRFISAVLVCVIAVLGLFGVMFFQITQTSDSQITDLTRRVHQLEITVRPPLHNSAK